MARWYRGLLAGVLIMLLVPAFAKAPDKNDVRVLIDISGSMKQNDPQNLRRPALRMLVGLLQPGTRAGVWTFAKWSNPLVPLAEVDPEWKNEALALSKRIQSPGMFTDIERVLQDALDGWEGEPTSHNRHLVLLTDGMVDVSKTPGESEASRARVLEELLPRLKQMQAKVHTIALSDRADHDLMQRLSGETGGWYQQVEGADQLKRVFLKVFEQVGKPEGVPLQGNRFTVDASVREATVLLFREPGSPDPTLVSPSGERYSDSDLIAGVAWFRDEGYDLVTLSTPARGDWVLEADLDPDNRVMIVTDLKLETSALPAHLATGESIMMRANLTNKGTVVRRKAFLRLLDVGSHAVTPDGKQPLGLNDQAENGDEEAGDGRYSARFDSDRAEKEVELVFSIESPTFMREKRYLLAVHEPAELTLEADADEVRAVVTVAKAVMREGAVVELWQEENGSRTALVEADAGYALKDSVLPVFMKIEGVTKLGNPVSRTFGPVYADGSQPPPSVEKATPIEPISGVSEEGANRQAAAEEEAPVTEEEVTEESSWVMPVVILGVSNLLLIGGGLAFWLLRRRRPKEEVASLEDDIAAIGSSSADSPGEHDASFDIGGGDEKATRDREKAA